MSLSKLKKLHVIIIGSVLCVIAGVAVFFLQVRPQMQKFAAAETRYNAAYPKGNPGYKATAITKRDEAIKAFQDTQALLDIQMKKRMPSLNFARRDIGMLALWKEQIKVLGPLLEGFAHDKNVVTRQANFTIAAPPANPNDPVFDKDVLEFPLGQVTVSGDFKSLMNNVRRWNNCGRLVMVGPPSLSGTSPQLTQAYSLTCYIFPVAKGGHIIQMAGGGAATPGAAGAPAAPPAMPAPPPTPPAGG